MGAYDLVHVEAGGHPLIAKTEAESRFKPGDTEYLHFLPDRAFLFREAVRCGSIAPLDGEGAQ
jgi:glycerol transport system ATP-binding protein